MEWSLLLLYTLLPFVEVGGESAFRFDVPTLKLHVFGVTLWMQEFYYVLLATLAFTFFFLFITLVFGRVWCGWICPQTVYTDLTDYLKQFSQKGVLAKGIAHLLFLAISVFIGFITVCYFVSPYEAIPQLLAGELNPVASGSTIVLGILLYLDLVYLRRIFCATICPYAKLQGAMTDDRSLIITLDGKRADECIQCRQCCKVCPTNLDIRKGMQIGCVMCAACIDACREVMGPDNKAGLIQYQFGDGNATSWKSLIRPVPVILALLVTLFSGILVYQTHFRSPFDFAVLPHSMEPKATRDGGVVNAFILSVKNMEDEPIKLEFIADKTAIADGFTFSIKEELVVSAGLVARFPLFVRAQKKIDGNRNIGVQLRLLSGEGQQMRRELYFTRP